MTTIAEHVVVIQQSGRILCRGCSESVPLLSPKAKAVQLILPMLQEFLAAHRACRVRKEEARS